MPDIDQRLNMYRRLSRAGDADTLADLKAELIDRFGPLPRSVSNLLLKVMLKIDATAAGVQRVDFTSGMLLLVPGEGPRDTAGKFLELALAQPGRYKLSPDRGLQAMLSPGELKTPFRSIKKILREIGHYVNS